MQNTNGLLRPAAHRGLHDKASGVLENTGAAFRLAIGAGVGIECDVRAAADGTPVVFHDATLSRLVDSEQHVGELSGCEIATLHYRDCGQAILTLPELLMLVGGRVPLLVEVKTDFRPMSRRFASNVADCLTAYRGPVGLMSFDTSALDIFRQLAPDVVRGVVAQSSKNGTYDTVDTARPPISNHSDFALWRMCEPSFCAYFIDDLPSAHLRNFCAALDLGLFAWTVHTDDHRHKASLWADAAIFEGRVPS